MIPRNGFSRRWLVLSLLWAAAVGAYQSGDIAETLAGSPIEIRYKSPLQVRFGLGPAPPGKSAEESADIGARVHADRRFVFPAGTPAGVMAQAIDDWAAAGNAVEDKLRARLPLSAFSDDALRRLAEIRDIGLDPSRGVRDQADWAAELARPPALGEMTPYPLTGAQLAAQALEKRPGPGRVAANFAVWALLPSAGLFVLGMLVRF
ncbi:MAG TPA: hypothetical protein VN795_08440 [Stellaceae bacterium]|jgi:hypothetical protein|nr:hypothetical protein [Stellaceae bacterium]